MTKTLYAVMEGWMGSDAMHAHSVHSDRASAESMVLLIEQPDEDGNEDNYAFVSEVDFYD